MSEFERELRQAVVGFWKLTKEQCEALESHFALLQRWNPRLNLTRITRLDEAVVRHYGESIFLASQLPPGPLRVVDLGSGAGFPGFPLAVVRPECRVVLVEAHRRKAVFLQEAARGIPNLAVMAVRVQDMVGEFDWAVCRAVSWKEVGEEAMRLAANTAFLGGEVGIRCPWAEKRFLRFVSRGTSLESSST